MLIPGIFHAPSERDHLAVAQDLGNLVIECSRHDESNDVNVLHGISRARLQLLLPQVASRLAQEHAVCLLSE